MKENVEIVLKNLIMDYGMELCNNRLRLLGLLLDLCSNNEREIRILIKVLDTGIISEFLNGTKKQIDQYTCKELVNKLHNNFGLTKEDALWAMETWLKAIDFKCGGTYALTSPETVKNNIVSNLEKNEMSKAKTPKRIKYRLLYVVIGVIILSGVYFFINNQKKNENLSINIGDYIEFGRYNGKSILWRVINKDVNGYMLFSEKIICFKAFDARGDEADGRGDADRIGFGSNYWEKSNLREWLNSYDKEVKYSHQVPDKEDVLYSFYDREPGFLYSFTDKERGFIKEVTHKSILANIDKVVMDGGTESYEYNTKIQDCVKNYDSSYYKNVTDKVFLLSTKEIKNFVYDRGWEYQKTAVNDDTISWYWLRTPFASYSDIVRAVGQDAVYGDDAYNGTGGVAPALYLKSKTIPGSGEGTKGDPYEIGK
ncbi:DUF6273 domain-containing protein [Clostridium sp. WILCCON 0269]|uniref:DUF6273 domain-containing protein n=1 Tax=Candidatus Clostridium eludens TaxID=3381663 RepID=A0ABW8SGR1_9CLOT